MNYHLLTVTRNGQSATNSFETAQELGQALANALVVGSTIIGFNTPDKAYAVITPTGAAPKEIEPLRPSLPPNDLVDSEPAVNTTGQVAEPSPIPDNVEEIPAPIPVKEEPKKKSWFK